MNGVNPDDVIRDYGADVLRLYEMFMGEFELPKPWDPRAIEGLNRFLKRVWRLVEEWDAAKAPADDPHGSLRHKTIKRVTADLERMQFNTAVAAHDGVRERAHRQGRLTATREDLLTLVKLRRARTRPTWATRPGSGWARRASCSRRPGRRWDEALTVDATVTLAVQVDGKVRGTVELAARRQRGRRARRRAGAAQRHQAPRGPQAQQVHLQARPHHRDRLRARVTARGTRVPRIVVSEPVDGIEPSTYGLRNRCSTTELHRPMRGQIYHVSAPPREGRIVTS